MKKKLTAKVRDRERDDRLHGDSRMKKDLDKVKRGEMSHEEFHSKWLGESEQLDELSYKKMDSYFTKAATATNKAEKEGDKKTYEKRMKGIGKALHNMKKKMNESDDPCWKGYKKVGMKKKAGKDVPNCVKEDVDQIDELSTKTIDSYMKKNNIAAQIKRRGDLDTPTFRKNRSPEQLKRLEKIRDKREAGDALARRAIKRKTSMKEDVTIESYREPQPKMTLSFGIHPPAFLNNKGK